MLKLHNRFDDALFFRTKFQTDWELKNNPNNGYDAPYSSNQCNGNQHSSDQYNANGPFAQKDSAYNAFQ